MQQQVQAALPVLRCLAAAGPDLLAAAGACLRVESLALDVVEQRQVPTSPQQLTALAAALAGALRSALGALLADWPATERHVLQPDAQPGAALHQAACATAGNLCVTLAVCACAQSSASSTPGAGSPQAGGAALLVRLVLAPSGLLPLLVQAATAAAGSLERCIASGSSSPQLQRAVSGGLADLSTSLLRLWHSCVPLLDPSRQPEQQLEVMQGSAVPVARLSLSLLRAAAAGSSSGEAPRVPEALRACVLAALTVADRALATLRAGSNQELSGGASAATAHTAGLAAVRQLSTHPAVLQAAALAVVLVSLQLRHGAAAEAAEAASAGADTAARLQQHVQDLAAVPAHHAALLAALGLPGLEELVVRLQVRITPDSYARALSNLSALLNEQADATVSVGADDTSGSNSGSNSGSSGGGSDSGSRNGSSGGGSDGRSDGSSGGGDSSSSGSGSGSEGDASHLLTRLAPATLEAAALVALVVAASGRDQASSHAANDGVIAGLASFRASMFALAAAGAADPALGEGSRVQPSAGPGSGAALPSWERDAQPPPQQQQQQQQGQQQLDASLCSEALLVLVPAVQRACSVARQQAPEFVAEWEEALSCTLRQALLGPSPASVAGLSEAVLQQPLNSVAALEAALRQCATGGETGLGLAKCSWTISWAVGCSGPLSWDEPDTWGQLDALAAAAAADPGGLGKRVFALLLSCVKAARLSLAAADGSSMLAVSSLWGVMWVAAKQGGPQLLAATASVLQAAEDCTACPATEQAACSAGDQLSSSDGGGWPHGLLRAPLMPWLVLVARCLEAAAWWCQLPDELHRQQRQDAEQLHAATAVLATCCHHTVVWLGVGLQQLVPMCQAQPGEAQAAAGAAEQRVALEQLLAQQEQLQASLELAVDSDGSSMPPFDAPLAAQLQAFAVGVVRELPLRLCCNSPACTSMRCTSELLLVGGKACICAGCGIEAARYCSRDCQASHWKQHRRACKRLAAVQGALID